MVEHGLQYLLNCYIKDPTDYGNAQGDIYVYQVGDIVKERRRWFRPEDVTVWTTLHAKLNSDLSAGALLAKIAQLFCVPQNRSRRVEQLLWCTDRRGDFLHWRCGSAHRSHRSDDCWNRVCNDAASSAWTVAKPGSERQHGDRTRALQCHHDHQGCSGA